MVRLENLQSHHHRQLSHVRWRGHELISTIGNGGVLLSLPTSGASAGNALFTATEALAPGAVLSSSKSSKFTTGSGAGSGTLLAALDFAVDVRVEVVGFVEVFPLEEVPRRGVVSNSPASYSSKSDLRGVLSRNPLLLPPPV
jgi:hypothetical protein